MSSPISTIWQTIISFWWFLLIVIIFEVLYIIIRSRLPFLIGRSGERFVSKRLNRLDPTHYKVLDNLMLPSKGRMSTTQIDHVIVSSYGIFCIETKAHDGWIIGDADKEYWTQSTFLHRRRLYNPLRQNFAHVKAIEEAIGLQRLKAPVVPFVVFTNASRLKVSGVDFVGNLKDMLKKINAFTKVIFSDAERDEIYYLLVSANIVDKGVRRSHDQIVRNLKGR